MELSNSEVTAAVAKTPEPDSDTPAKFHPSKPLPFSNGVLKRHAPLHVHHGNLSSHHPPVVVTYKECLKNHAASLGGHAVDGCGEFMTSPMSNPAEPASLKCAACGCHRNFHRREPDELQLIPPPNANPAMEYQPHHRHHPPPPVSDHRHSSVSPNNSPSPPPISSAYYPSAPHMLLALSHGLSGPSPNGNTPIPLPCSTTPLSSSSPNAGRKRFRSKFTQDQKEQMLQFAERVDWRMQKKDEDLISEFCAKIGVERGVLKVWMHNNKNTLAKKDHLTSNNASPSAAAVEQNDNSVSGGIGYGSIGAISDVATAHFHRHQHLQESSSDTKLHSSSSIGQDFSHHHFHNNTGITNSHATMAGTNGSSS